ncbi:MULTISPECIES: hypothetical protein [unclassified Streptomyces]|uniref:hypothetical protein n=1 Tax=unclassified Streptomyces TaxID=2593676 RepID=UPI00114CDC5C|nr:hypothetical protein [Streptomyces sp. MnatMP-M77]
MGRPGRGAGRRQGRAEGTRVPAAEGVDRIRAATDLGNVPMAKSFERLGYVTFEPAFTMVGARDVL